MAFLDPKLSRDILKLALPVVLAMLTQTAINIMDTVMVGWLNPSYSIAGQSALAYSLPLLWLVGGFLSSIAVGTLAISARRLGEDKADGSGRALTNSVFIAVISGTIFSILGYLAVPYVFPLLNDNESVLAFGVPYAQWRILGVFSMVATISYKSFFDGIGQTHIHMWTAIVMNIANITLNYIFIFGFAFVPAYFVEGAGIASLISTYIGLAMMVAWSFKKDYRLRFQYYRISNISRKVMKDILSLSIPSGFATVFVMLGFLVFFKIVGALDAAAVTNTLASISAYNGEGSSQLLVVQRELFAALDFNGRIFSADLGLMSIETRPPIFTTATKVISDILSVTFMSAMAFGTGTATLISQSMGRGDSDLAERYGWESVKLGVIFFGVLGLFIFSAPEMILGWFNSDPSVIKAAVPPLRLVATIQIFVGTALILTQALFGAGDSRFVMWVEMILHAVCLVPLTYVLGVTFDLGIMGVWIALAIYVILLAIIMTWKFRTGSWKKIQI